MTKELAIDTKIKGTQNASIKALTALLEVLPQSEMPIDHYFSDGLYARKMKLPASALIVGKEHKHNHLAILLKGEVAVVSKQGKCIYHAPYVVNVLKGDQRAFFAVTDVEWMTIHATTETDIEVLERTLVEE